MRKHLLLLLCLASFASLAQDNWYRSAANEYYWKNRKPYEGYWQQDVHYKLKATIDDKTDIVEGYEELTYFNNSPDTLNFVYFHLYENAFVKGAYLENLNLANNFKQKFGKYEAAGKGTTIEQLEVNGVQATTYLDNTILRVQLPQPLLPGASTFFLIKFKTYFDDGGTQRRRMKLYKDNWGNKHYNGVHWYPRICVYDRKFGWETAQHLGKEFYGDFGTFDAELTLPNHYVMDATGELQNSTEVFPGDLRARLDIKNFANKPWDEKPSEITKPDGTTKTWKFHGENVHDFAWTADPTYRIGEVETIRGIKCISLAQEPHARGWQDAAQFCAKVIQTYSRDFGMYAYPKMIVADAADGMEYPMLTLDGGSSPGYYGLIAHEVGHNWFFGMVGNNETYRASLDEGFTQFLTHWSMSRILPEQPVVRSKNGYLKKYSRPLPQMDQTVYLGYLRDAINNDDMPLNTHSDDFNGALHHGGGYGHVYYKTATMLYNLQYVLGDEKFQGAMQHYFNQWKMCHPYFEDFRNSITSYTHTDLNWFFDQWLETTKNIDYKIRNIKPVSSGNGGETKIGNMKTYLVTLERKGEMQMPIDLMVYDKKGNIKTHIIPNTYYQKKPADNNSVILQPWVGWSVLNREYKALVFAEGGIKKVVIDTTYRLADINQLDNSSKCPVLFTFDHQLRNPTDRRHYILKWRPDLWWNNYDGIKAGLHFNGNYMNLKHVFSLTAWYNTDIATNYNSSGGSLADRNHDVNYKLSYAHRIARNLDINLQARLLDGLLLNQLGFEKTAGKESFRVFFKSMYRENIFQLNYIPSWALTEITPGFFFTPRVWNENRWNNSLNLEWDHRYNYVGGNGKITTGTRASALGSDYDYASIYVNATNSHNTGKLEWRTRLYLQYLSGLNIAPESQLYLAGASPEEMMENKFTRASGPLPYEWFTYGATTNHYHAGGGLNLRGYSGYLMPVVDGPGQFFLFKGNRGASFNLELDYDKLFNFHPARLSRAFHIDAYLFADAGWLSDSREFIFLNSPDISSNVLADAGAGFVFTLKRWGMLEEIKPLSIRFDMPLYLSNAPFADGDNFKFRWVLGINRTF